MIMPSKLVLRNEFASIISRDKEFNFSSLIVVLFGFFICFNWENERSAEQFVTINAENMRKLISTFGKVYSMLLLTITFSIFFWSS